MELTAKVKKTLNMGLRVVVALLSLWFIYLQVFRSGDYQWFAADFPQLLRERSFLIFFLPALLLMPVNWSLESIKWRMLALYVRKLSFGEALRSVLTGISFSLFTPNRVGDSVGRIFSLRIGDPMNAVLLAVAGSLAQIIATCFSGSLAFLFYIRKFFDFHEAWLSFFYAGLVIFVAIINLLMRFYDYDQGSIRLDGTELRDISKTSLRSHISLVLQDVFLFSGNVRDNITLRNPDITDESIINAAKLLDAHRFIMALPGGYDFVVSERGHNLSSGQRQLISLVRALVYNPSILILDEATASIDTETEAIVQYAIEKLLRDRTAIIIAHRLSTIRNADKIMVLEHGHILEQGSHDELLQNPDSRYSELYNIQFENKLSTKV